MFRSSYHYIIILLEFYIFRELYFIPNDFNKNFIFHIVKFIAKVSLFLASLKIILTCNFLEYYFFYRLGQPSSSWTEIRRQRFYVFYRECGSQ